MGLEPKELFCEHNGCTDYQEVLVTGNIKDKLEDYTDIFPNTTKYYGENTTTFAAEFSIDFEEEEHKKDMNDISVEVYDFKDANEALENQVEVCNDEKVKTEPDMKALEDQDEGQRINAFEAVKIKTESEV